MVQQQHDSASDYVMIMFITLGRCTHEDNQKHGS